MHTILLSLEVQGWVAKFSDPAIAELFGTDTLPTAFGFSAKPPEVLATVRGQYPGHTVSFLSDRNNGVEAEANALGADIEACICWTWANGFATSELAGEFCAYLDWSGYAHSGAFDLRGAWCVGFR